jgi:hypothetical protein
MRGPRTPGDKMSRSQSKLFGETTNQYVRRGFQRFLAEEPTLPGRRTVTWEAGHEKPKRTPYPGFGEASCDLEA